MIAIMKLWHSMEDFQAEFERVFTKTGYQLTFSAIDWGLPG